MLSRTQYNVNDYFKKCVDSTFHLGMGLNTIASTLICWKSKTLIPGVLPSARFVNNFVLYKTYMAVETVQGEGESG